MSLECLPRLTPASSELNAFSMVFIDFDDTLFPTKMYRFFANNLSIDINSLFAKNKLCKLQNAIIRTIESIRSQYRKENRTAHFCVVSNGNQKWLDFILKGSKEHEIPSQFPILDTYFVHNSIPVISAYTKSNHLKHSFSDTSYSMLNNSKDKHVKWIRKYTVFASVISSLENTTNKKCEQIISIGDSKDEYKALKQYATACKVKSLHVNFVKSPTISQLKHQWIHLRNSLLIKIKLNQLRKDKLFVEYDLRKVKELKSDNNKQTTGKTQLTAIQNYFHLWMTQLDSTVTEKQKGEAIQIVCKSIHQKMYAMDPGSKLCQNFKLIVSSILRNDQFHVYFDEYYQNVRRRKLNQSN